MIQEIEAFIEKLGDLIQKIKQNSSDFVSKKSLKGEIAILSKGWLQKISTGLRTESLIVEEEINRIDAIAENVLELASGNNRKNSYLKLLQPLSKSLQRDILIPLIKSTRSSAPIWQGVANKITSSITSPEEKNYYEEAFRAAANNCYKAAVVMTGCAVIDRLRKFVVVKGLPLFNKTSTKLKNTNSGFYSRFNKEYKIRMENELQEVFDNDLVMVISGIVSLDLNQTKAILSLLNTRNSCAHPSSYSVDELAYAYFLNEVYNLVISNPKLT